jgi:exodeoxyribonuclease VII large subunit
MKDPRQLITPLIDELKIWSKALRQEMSHLIELAMGDLAQSTAQLRALSPLAVLERGYAVALTKKGDLIREINQVSSGDDFQLRLARGEIAATVRGTTEFARNKSASER